jgi:predicted nucleic-acid-binding protein
VRTFDTNAVIRIVLGDDPQQTTLATQQWLEALRTGGIFLPIVVLVEVVWVLARSAKLSRERILSELQRLTDMEGVWVENAPVVRRAIQLFAKSSADFADCLVLESARAAGALPVHTFDRRFAHQKDVTLMTEVPAP